MQVRYEIRITRQYVKDHPQYLFVFGDNVLRSGAGGQAIIRGLPNAIGIATKWKPATDDASYFMDGMLEEQTKIIDTDIDRMIIKSSGYTEVVFPIYGIGTGMAQLEKRAPKTGGYLNKRLAEIGIENPLIK